MKKIPNPRAALKVIFINLSILGILFITPSLAYSLYKQNKSKCTPSQDKACDRRAYYPTYTDKKFSIELFNELGKLSNTYKSFLGWRRKNIQLKYTKISGQYNTRNSLGESLNNSAWFFGGSTMWGTGASDQQTIPSHFNSLTSRSVYNFGEGGWWEGKLGG